MRPRSRLLLAPVLAAAVAAAAPAEPVPRTPAPADAELYFISPRDGERVASPVTVRFGLQGMGVAPAGVDAPNTGHHHLIIDAALPPLDRPVPADDRHLHFGAGQTEARVELAPGTHTLQLLLGDRNHVPHDPPVVSPRISITVE
jgi:hypothetical protein